MKNISLLFLAIILFSCNNSNENPILNSKNESLSYKFYGKVISQDSIKNLEVEKESLMNTGIKTSKISGRIVETCSKKGCWMTLDTGEDTLFIKFRDYAFFVPKDSAEGKKAIVQGDLFLDTVTIEMLKHYAEDAGKSEEEIAQITEPSYDMGFTADGVIIAE
tara:strand:+ start:334 stop:822 length:489 start_codon:yes stop_codon:yes gene_type:complete